ncbi:hypothetical protein [Kitasatospora sp. NPDC094015]|uniref:hypothetical protein n=1 Tax=Kitasatospora sp. NPDC094015 TaxID=3155205 RepID=UPI0033286542
MPARVAKAARMFGGETSELVITNGGDVPLELIVEPGEDSYPILPGQFCVLTTHAPAQAGGRSGARYEHRRFEVVQRPDSITVRPIATCFHLVDQDCGAIDAADQQCPAR